PEHVVLHHGDPVVVGVALVVEAPLVEVPRPFERQRLRIDALDLGVDLPEPARVIGHDPVEVDAEDEGARAQDRPPVSTAYICASPMSIARPATIRLRIAPDTVSTAIVPTITTIRSSPAGPYSLNRIASASAP